MWLIPFVVAVLAFPFRSSLRPLFESIMAVAVTLAAVVLANLYFRKVEASYLKEGVFLGLVWLLISLGIDLPLVAEGPMKMTLADYMADIGLTYLIIPTVTIGFGHLLATRRWSDASAS
jgi:hypothetical protein